MARVFIVALAALATLSARPARGYSVLAHEANIDAAWESAIVPTLKHRFPGTTAAELANARAYAYGGSVIQDLGYYPFGSQFFSDLLHYVRTGDFVMRLIADASDVNELAFGLGALAHYAADSDGHPLATNRVVPMIYPKLRRKFGDRVTYAQSPREHVLVEFSFDVVQAATGAYASEAYHQLIGFKVAMPGLERAVRGTYGLEMQDLFTNLDLAVGTYRHAVSTLIPEMTKVAWRDKQQDILHISPQMQEAAFVFRITPREYTLEYGVDYTTPKWYARFLGVLFKLLPKFGPFRPMAFTVPTPEAEQLFLESFVATQERYRGWLAAVRQHELQIANRDLDTGVVTVIGEYARADTTYARLLDKLSRRKFKDLPPELARNIAAFYGSVASLPGDTSRHHRESARVRAQLADMTARLR
jgi:zinc dependent phospholipase C